MASILLFEIDLLAQLEAIKINFSKIPDFSHLELFKKLDSDQDGEVTVSDIVSFFQRLGIDMSREDAATIINRIMFDISISNSTESFCVEEFVNFMIPLQPERESNIQVSYNLNHFGEETSDGQRDIANNNPHFFESEIR